VTAGGGTLSRLEAARREQAPQALARLVLVGLFIGLWVVLWAAHIPMPVPFLVCLLLEALFFVGYWQLVRYIPSERGVRLAHYGMLAPRSSSTRRWCTSSAVSHGSRRSPTFSA